MDYGMEKKMLALPLFFRGAAVRYGADTGVGGVHEGDIRMVAHRGFGHAACNTGKLRPGASPSHLPQVENDTTLAAPHVVHEKAQGTEPTRYENAKIGHRKDSRRAVRL